MVDAGGSHAPNPGDRRLKSALLKILASVLASVVARFGPELLAEAAKRLSAIKLPSVAGFLSRTEFESIVLKSTGAGSLSALAVEALTYLMVHDGDFIKNPAIVGLATFALGVVIQGIKTANGGPASEGSPPPEDPPASALVALAEPFPCPICTTPGDCSDQRECRAHGGTFTGKIAVPLNQAA